MEADQINEAPPTSENSWNWTRTAENAAASSAVAVAQYHAIESVISKHFDQLKQEVKQSEARTAQLLKQVAGIQKKKKSAKPREKVDAMKAEEVARRLLE